MRTVLTLSLAAAVSSFSAAAYADMPSGDCSGREDCSSCSPDGNVSGYCEGEQCVEGDPSDCGQGGCAASGSTGRFGGPTLVLGGVAVALAIAWNKKRGRRG